MLSRLTGRSVQAARRSPALQRAASMVPQSMNNVPSIPEGIESDPQLEGLGYPQIPGVSRQLRPAKKGWWDEQERVNQHEILAENEDIQTMWGPDLHSNFTGPQALRYLAVAATVMATVTYTIYLTKPARPLNKLALLGTEETEFKANNACLTSEVTSVSFASLTSRDIRQISVLKIFNPELFDSLNRPNAGGLYDTRLGPLERGDICATCRLSSMDCPGHFGHIDLPVPVMHTLFIRHLYDLVRGMCVYCHHLKLSKFDTLIFTTKLFLLERGFLVEALGLDRLLARPVSDKRKEEDGSEDEEDVTERVTSDDQARLTNYVAAIQLDSSSDYRDTDGYQTGAAYEAKRTVIRQILATAISKTFCSKCSAKSHRYRKEGSNKVMETALTAKQRQFNLSKGLDRPSIAVVKRMTDRLKRERESGVLEEEEEDEDEDVQMADAPAHDVLAKDAPAKDAPATRSRSPPGRERDATPSESGDSEGEGDDLMQVDESGPLVYDARLPKPAKKKQAPKGEKKPREKQAERFVSAEELRANIRLLFAKESNLMNSIYGMHSHNGKTRRIADPDMFFIDTICVPPVRFRPAALLNGVAMENPQNELLGNILASAIRIGERSAALKEMQKKPEAESSEAAASRVLDANKAYVSLLDSITMLQHSVNSLIDSSKNPTRLKGGKQNPDGIKQVLEKKEGLFRMNMMGKRVNYAARSVISPDINIETDEIGVPPVFAKKLTYPEPVNYHNFKLMQQLVINGCRTHPGAVAVEDENGVITSLATKTDEERVAISQLLLQSTPRPANPDRPDVGLPTTRTPQTYKKVHRHLTNGDIVILNRQPSLHKPSMMCHRVRVLKGEKTIRMHYANCNSYNADFDGDEMNMHFPQNIIAQSEARSIANTDSQYLVPTSGDPIRGLIQDHVVSAVHMTNKETFFDREEYHQLLFGSLRLEEGRIQTVTPAIIKPRPLWTGKQVISTIMKNLTPHGFAGLNLRSTSKTPGKRWGIHASEDSVLFVDGDLLTGILDKAQFGASSYGMVHSVYEIYGAEAAGRLLGILSRLFTAYLQMRGFTCGMDDLRLTAAGETIRNDLVEGARERGLKAALGFVQLADADPASSSTQTHLRTRLEEVLRDDNKQAGLDRAMMAETSVLTSSIIEKTLPSEMEKRFPDNNMALMTVSGAKGSNVNVSQIACLLGQQALEGRRVPTMVSGKTLPSFRAFDTQPRAGGFVAQRFLTGIKPQEYYFHCMAGREGLIDTAVKTSRSGYLQRCLIKHLEGCKVAYDSTVRNSDGDIIQFYYGEDGLDVTKQKHLTQFEFSLRNFDSLSARYNPSQAAAVLEQEHAVAHMKTALASRAPDEDYVAPTLSLFNPARHFGSVSETFAAQIAQHVEENPGRLLQAKKRVRKAENWPEWIDHKKLQTKDQFRALMHMKYIKSLVDPGEAVGLLASQGVGEPSTQMTLNTFHLAGHGAANVTLGIPRLKEVLQNASAKPATPTMKIPFCDSVKPEMQKDFVKHASKLVLSKLIDRVEVKEVLTNRDSGARNRLYNVTLHLYPSEEYIAEYGTTVEEVLGALSTDFLRRLENAISKSLKKIKKQLATQREDIGKGHNPITDRSSGDNVDGDNDEEAEEGAVERAVRATARGQVQGEEGADEEGDFDDMKRQEQSKTDREYDDGSDHDVPPDDSASDGGDSDGSEDSVERAIRKASQMQGGKGRPMSVDSHAIDAPLHVRAHSPDTAARMDRMSTLEEEALAGRKYVSKFEFDKHMGEYCKVQLEFGSREAKLLLVGIIEQVCRDAVVREILGIDRCLLTPADKKDPRDYCVTEGANMKAMWTAGYDKLDLHALYSNDIAGMLRTYGVEAARATLIKEVSAVFAVYGIGVNVRHLTLIADYMMHDGGYKPFNRTGMASAHSPFLKSSFETTGVVITDSVLHGDFDNLQNPSASIVMGKIPLSGTGIFSVMADLNVKPPRRDY